MPLKCPSCNKYASYEAEEPELENLDLDGRNVSASVNIKLLSACCGEELKQGTIELTGDFDEDVTQAHQRHELYVEDGGVDLEENRVGSNVHYSARLFVLLRCPCQPAKSAPLAKMELTETIARSEMEDLV